MASKKIKINTPKWNMHKKRIVKLLILFAEPNKMLFYLVKMKSVQVYANYGPATLKD